MTLRLFSETEKLDVLNGMIVDMKTARMYGKQLDILRAIASDIHGRMPETAMQAMETLEKKVAYVVTHKIESGYDQATLAHLGGYVIGFWPTLRAALVEYTKEKV